MPSTEDCLTTFPKRKGPANHTGPHGEAPRLVGRQKEKKTAWLSWCPIAPLGSVHLSLIFFLFLRLDHFNCAIFKFTNSFFYSKLILKPSNEFFISAPEFLFGFFVYFYHFINILILFIYYFLDFLHFFFNSLSISWRVVLNVTY